jgi:hypothetical protein
VLIYIAQGVGLLAMTFAIISFQKNSNKGILRFQLIAAITFSIHFFLLGAYTGSIMNILGSTRNIIFFNRDKSWARKSFWPYLFICLYILCGIITWSYWYSILPIAGMILNTLGLWNTNPKITRRIVLPSSPLWLLYNIFTMSIAGILTEIFVLTSLIVAVFRFDFVKKSVKE